MLVLFRKTFDSLNRVQPTPQCRTPSPTSITIFFSKLSLSFSIVRLFVWMCFLFTKIISISIHRLTDPILDSLEHTHYTPPDGTAISPKEILKSLLPRKTSQRNPNITEHQVRTSIKDFALACALLSASQSSTHELLSWIPRHLSAAVESTFEEISIGYVRVFAERNSERMAVFGVDYSGSVREDKRLIVELMPEVLPVLKETIKESSIDKSSEGDEISAASARAPVGNAILGAYQFRWFVNQVGFAQIVLLEIYRFISVMLTVLLPLQWHCCVNLLLYLFCG